MNAALVKVREAFDLERSTQIAGVARLTLCVACHNVAELIDVVPHLRAAIYECEHCGHVGSERIAL